MKVYNPPSSDDLPGVYQDCPHTKNKDIYFFHNGVLAAANVKFHLNDTPDGTCLTSHLTGEQYCLDNQLVVAKYANRTELNVRGRVGTYNYANCWFYKTTRVRIEHRATMILRYELENGRIQLTVPSPPTQARAPTVINTQSGAPAPEAHSQLNEQFGQRLGEQYSGPTESSDLESQSQSFTDSDYSNSYQGTHLHFQSQGDDESSHSESQSQSFTDSDYSNSYQGTHLDFQPVNFEDSNDESSLDDTHASINNDHDAGTAVHHNDRSFGPTSTMGGHDNNYLDNTQQSNNNYSQDEDDQSLGSATTMGNDDQSSKRIRGIKKRGYVGVQEKRIRRCLTKRVGNNVAADVYNVMSALSPERSTTDGAQQHSDESLSASDDATIDTSTSDDPPMSPAARESNNNDEDGDEYYNQGGETSSSVASRSRSQYSASSPSQHYYCSVCGSFGATDPDEAVNLKHRVTELEEEIRVMKGEKISMQHEVDDVAKLRSVVKQNINFMKLTTKLCRELQEKKCTFPEVEDTAEDAAKAVVEEHLENGVLGEHDEQIDGLMGESAKLKQDLSTAESDILQLDNAVEKCQGTAEEQEVEIKTLREEVETAVSEFAVLEDEFGKQCKGTVADLAAAKADRAAAKYEVATMKVRLQQLELMVKELQQANRN
eukprot:scaffold29732_cov94-Skeletonema_marinoi.AAC.1